MAASSLRRPMRSDSTPEKTLVTAAVASATPSISPTAAMLIPRLSTRNRGSRAWIISDEMSMNREMKPSAQTVRGTSRQDGWWITGWDKMPPGLWEPMTPSCAPRRQYNQGGPPPARHRCTAAPDAVAAFVRADASVAPCSRPSRTLRAGFAGDLRPSLTITARDAWRCQAGTRKRRSAEQGNIRVVGLGLWCVLCDAGWLHRLDGPGVVAVPDAWILCRDRSGRFPATWKSGLRL